MLTLNKSGSCNEIISIQTTLTSPVEAFVVRVYERKTPFCSKPFKVVQNKVHVEFIPTLELLQQEILIPEGFEVMNNNISK